MFGLLAGGFRGGGRLLGRLAGGWGEGGAAAEGAGRAVGGEAALGHFTELLLPGLELRGKGFLRAGFARIFRSGRASVFALRASPDKSWPGAFRRRLVDWPGVIALPGSPVGLPGSRWVEIPGSPVGLPDGKRRFFGAAHR